MKFTFHIIGRDSICIGGQRYNADIWIYDTEGNLQVEMNYLKKSIITKNKLIAYTEILNSDLYDFLYEKDNRIKDDQSFLFHKYLISNKSKPCKLVLESSVLDTEGYYKKIVYEFPNAAVHTNFNRRNDGFGDAAQYKIVFDLLPFDTEDHIFKVNIEK